MANDVSAGRPWEKDEDAAEKLSELETIGEPTQFDRGTLTALRLSRLEPAERKRVVALVGKWKES